ncbi:MAG: hypothetical protein ACRDHO_11840 [Actinomycetota bacterium]
MSVGEIDPTLTGRKDVDRSRSAKRPSGGASSAEGFQEIQEIQEVDSTAYCLTETMANGELAHPGAAAMNGVPFGTRVVVLDGPLGGRRLVVKDRIGRGSEFDVAMPGECRRAREYGRRQIRIRVEP